MFARRIVPVTNPTPVVVGTEVIIILAFGGTEAYFRLRQSTSGVAGFRPC